MNRSPRSLHALLRVLACAALVGFAGCGDRGPPRYDLSGAVTWDGQPVPRGYIVFTPDSAAGNAGPGTQADIVDGRYQTPPGEGTIGGPHTVSISGTDGKPYQDGPITNPNGRMLFSDLKQSVDLPKSEGQHDFSLTK